MSDVSFRLNDDTVPSLKKSFKEEKDEIMKKEKYKHISDIK